jgi:NAD(P)-dependent dehydrogenase (short-subunit alcohol dehydrogenase family)
LELKWQKDTNTNANENRNHRRRNSRRLVGGKMGSTDPNLDLQNKTVFITGGSRGLGLALAREFAKRGARIAISARAGDELQRAAAQLENVTSHVLTIEADVTMREEAESAIAKINERFGFVDVLVNNAGTITVGPLETMTIDDFRESLNTHFWGPYFATMAVLPEMRRRGAGSIVNISSVGGKISVPHLLPYSVGKFALTGFSEGLRAELQKDNIHVTTVCPGLMPNGQSEKRSIQRQKRGRVRLVQH